MVSWAKLLIVCGIVLSSSSIPYKASSGTMRKPPEKLGIYDGYSTPSWVLRGIAMTESGEADWAIGDGGISLGRMQLNEKYHSLRAKAWGKYNPRYSNDSIRITSCLFQENLKYFGSIPKAISAHRWGINGVRHHGIDNLYVAQVVIYGYTGKSY